jgi:glutamyl-tRNA(Gln) amidotransferase subunit D
MEVKELSPGDKVRLQTKDKTWEGNILESYDPTVILLKLKSGYNIGIREGEILKVKVLEKVKILEKKEITLAQNKKLPNIAIVITGGTISARLDPKTGGTTWTDKEEILNITPELSKICNITKIEKPFMKASEDMSFKDWKKIAQTTEKLLNNKDIGGVIITHGTDFLHYTSAALSFFLPNLNKPVALTYSQRSIDRGSTDAALNLLCAAKYAISDVAEIALIGHKNLDDNVCLAMPGTKVRKMHTSRRDAFQIINDDPLVEISESNFKILKEFNARNDKKVKLDLKFDENVALIKTFPGQNPEILDFYVEKGCKGIILELSGLGHISGIKGKHNWIPKIKQLITKGIIIAGVPQTISGSLNPNVYSAGRLLKKTDLIFLKDILPETALIKLGHVLGKTKNKEKIKELLLENISGEFNDKLSF